MKTPSDRAVAGDADWLRPDWPASGAGALMTTRHGGVSAAPFDSLNLRFGVGDDAACVIENRRRVAAAISLAAGRPVRPVYLQQVHGAKVVRLTAAMVAADAVADADADAAPVADGSVCTEPGLACTAQVADCLPVLFAAPGGVAAAHAGWRGLAAGVIEATLAALCEAARCAPQQVSAWLGPCIGPRRFEVGADVLRAFGRDPGGAGGAADPADPVASDRAFVPHVAADGSARWLADLPALARLRLAAAGAGHVSGGPWCTVDDPSRFFSYRRDRITGRMLAAVWLGGPAIGGG